MSYTPPSGNAVAFDFPAKVYSPPAGDALAFEWNSSTAPLLADAVASSQATGSLTTGIRLAGTASSVATVSAPALIDGQVTAYFNASIAATATVSGSLTTAIALGGAVAATVSVPSAGLVTAIRLAGKASVTVSGGASLSSAIRLSGTAQAQASVHIDLSAAARFEGAAIASASASAILSTGIRLSGALSAKSAVGKPLTRVASLSGGHSIHTANTSPQGVAYGPGIGFVVAARVALLHSSDGAQWAALPDPTAPSQSDWRGIAYGAGLFVAVRYGFYTTVFTSPDLISWTERTVPCAFAFNATSIRFVGGKFFLKCEPEDTVANDAVMLASDDCITWTTVSRPLLWSPGQTWAPMLYFNGSYFQPPASGVIFASADLTTWESLFVPFDSFVNSSYQNKPSFAETNGLAVAIVRADLFAVSRNLRDWEIYAKPFPGSRAAEWVCGFGGIFIVQYDYSLAKVSYDGRNWSSASVNAIASYLAYAEDRLVGVSGSSNYSNTATVYSITHEPSGVVLLSGGNSLSGAAVAESRPGNAALAAVESLRDNLPRASTWTGLVFGNGVFVASADETNGLYTLASSSGDGQWSIAQAPLHHSPYAAHAGYESVMSADWAPVQFVAGRFFLTTSVMQDITEAKDIDGYPLNYIDYYTTSEDGETWAAPKPQSIGYLCAGNGILVSNWSTGSLQVGTWKLKTSVDGGDNWITRNVLPQSSYQPIIFANGYFIIVDVVNRLYYRSVDCLTWDLMGALPVASSTVTGSARDYYIQAVGDWFVCFSRASGTYNFTMWISRTGDAWEAHTIPRYHGSLWYGNGLYVKVGPYADEVTDDLDGGTWTAFAAPDGDDLHSNYPVAAYGNGVFAVRVEPSDQNYMVHRLTQARTYVGTVDLTETPSDTSLSGEAIARASAQIDNRGIAHLEGAALCACGTTGALTARIRLSGTLASSIHRATSVLSTAKPIGAAHAAASATAGGQLTTRVSLPPAHGACIANLSAGLDTGIRLTAAVTTETFSGATTLDTAIHLMGNIGVVTTAIPRLTAPSKYDDAPVICVKARQNVMYVHSDRI